MPKFYIKTVMASMFLSVILLLLFNLIKGVSLNLFQRKCLIVLLVADTTFILLNEKATVRENWKWYMWLILLVITFLTGWIVVGG